MITASVVTYFTKEEDLSRLIACVLSSPVSTFYIIDHTPGEETLERVKNGRIIYVKHENLGYGSGHNIAIKKSIESGADYHVVLNPDVYWFDNVIGELERYMDANKDVGQIMPKIVYPNGEVQYLCKLLPTPMDLIGRRFVPIKSYRERHDKKYELHWTGYDKVMEVPSLSGCFMFIRCSVLEKTGGFDERYFMYAEDVDLCRRIGEISKTMFYPNVTVVHEYDKGSYKNKTLLKYHVTSMIKYFNKWGWLFDCKRRKRNKMCGKSYSTVS